MITPSDDNFQFSMRQQRRCFVFVWGTSVWHVSTSLVIRPGPSLRCESGTWWLVMGWWQYRGWAISRLVAAHGHLLAEDTHSSSWPRLARCDGSRSDPRDGYIVSDGLGSLQSGAIPGYSCPHWRSSYLFLHLQAWCACFIFLLSIFTFIETKNSFLRACLTWMRMSAQTPTVHCAGCNLEQMWSGDVRLSDVMSDARRGG